jgi:hypothetical protein
MFLDARIDLIPPSYPFSSIGHSCRLKGFSDGHFQCNQRKPIRTYHRHIRRKAGADVPRYHLSTAWKMTSHPGVMEETQAVLKEASEAVGKSEAVVSLS